MGKSILAEQLSRGESGYPAIRAILSHLDDLESIFVLFDQHQNIAYINDIGCSILKTHYHGAIGKNWFDHFIPKAYREETRFGFVEMMAGNINEFDTYINPVLSLDDREINVRWDNSLIRNRESGVVTGLFSTGKELLTPIKVARNIEIFPASQSVMIGGQHLELPISEFNLLEVLAHRAGQAVRREFLTRLLRGIEYDFGDRSLDMRVSSLRKKLNDSKPPYRYIKTIRSVGYMLVTC